MGAEAIANHRRRDPCRTSPRTSEHHDHYEKTHAEHHWWDWYAPYLSARQNGSSPAEAIAAANRYMDEVFHVLPR